MTIFLADRTILFLKDRRARTQEREGERERDTHYVGGEDEAHSDSTKVSPPLIHYMYE